SLILPGCCVVITPRKLGIFRYLGGFVYVPTLAVTASKTSNMPATKRLRDSEGRSGTGGESSCFFFRRFPIKSPWRLSRWPRHRVQETLIFQFAGVRFCGYIKEYALASVRISIAWR